MADQMAQTVKFMFSDVAEIYQLYIKLGFRHILSIRLANSLDSDFESRVKLSQSSLSGDL